MEIQKYIKGVIYTIVLCMITSTALSGADFENGGDLSSAAVFSDTPIDMTPVKQDYSPGLGDRMDGISYTMGLGWLGQPSGLAVTTTYEQALDIERKVSNITNGAHQIPFVIGQDVLRWGSAPYLIEDTASPMGDGTPGSGYRKYQEFVDESFKYNADVAQILEPLLAGSMRDDYASEEEKIPLSCYTHTADGQKKVGWSAGGASWYLLSLYNLYDTGYAQKAWQRNIDNWNFRTHIYYDALIPVPEGLYNNPNLTTQYGGKITTTEMEWEAVVREIKYSWENYAISSGQEYVYPIYKGLSVYFTTPYGYVSDDDYLNTWGNSVMISTRGGGSMNLVWGSEVSGHDDAFQFNGSKQPWGAFIKRMMEHNFQYLYMMERKPLSYTNNSDIHQVVFSGNLVSTYDKKTGNYTLVENGDFIIADGGDRFIPQAGAGCKIYVYSQSGKTRTWKLPDTWEGIDKVDLYTLSLHNDAVKADTLDVTDGCVTIKMSATRPYLIVPEGNTAKPMTAGFNDLSADETLETYQTIKFDIAGNPDIKVYGASARGGFGSPSIFADADEEGQIVQIGMEKDTILHSLKIGNKGGTGKVVLHSSNPLNPDVMISLPETDQVYKFNTNWRYGETENVTVKIENSDSVKNVLFDSIMYSPVSVKYGDANGDGKINLNDVSLIMKHIARWNVDIDEKTADANNDGKVNLNDVSIVMKYIAGWNVVLG